MASVIKSQFPDVAVPEDVSLPQYMLACFARYGDKVAITDHLGAETLTYSDLIRDIKRVAGNLHARGLRPGDVFGLYAPNQPYWPVAYLGAMLAGAVVMTANPNYTTHEVAHQVKVSNTKYILTVPSLLPHVAATGCRFQETFVFGSDPQATPFASLLAETAVLPPRLTLETKHSLAMLPFSSGTTSQPKAVRITHYNIIANLCQMDCPAMMDFSPKDTLVAVLPLFHIYGMVVVGLMGLVKGVTLVTFPRFEPTPFLEALHRHRVTVAHVAPPLVQFLAKSPLVDQYDLSALRTVFSAAAPLGQELAQALVTRLQGRCTVRQGYGMTEMTPISHMMPFASQHKYHSIGRLVPNMLMKVVDVETGLPVAPGQRGEFLLKGPNVMLGYLKEPGATAATLDAEGFLHTGDVGFMDEDGDCYIVDRCKELIKVKGFQVAPAELEDLLQGHPMVSDCAVIGVPFQEDERPKAFLVLKPGNAETEATAEAIKAYVAKRVAPYKRISEIAFVKAIPKSAAGKILRRELRSLQPKL